MFTVCCWLFWSKLLVQTTKILGLATSATSRKETSELSKVKEENAKMRVEFNCKVAEVEDLNKSVKALESANQKLRKEATNNAETWHRETIAMVHPPPPSFL